MSKNGNIGDELLIKPLSSTTQTTQKQNEGERLRTLLNKYTIRTALGNCNKNFLKKEKGI